ncbi:MAG: phosphatase PAP2 family protein [Ignavibacterium sp.]|uniref:phosphatase PAP2 family protein n=1 Tax=Ignavibacterium sp. TaxID=2651167 RepID=UPI00404928AA
MKIYFCFLFISIFNSDLFSQTIDANSNSSNIIPPFKDDVNSIYNTGIRLILAPSNFDRKDWITLGSVAALTSAGFFFDNENREFWQRNKTKTLNDISEVGRIYGEISYAAIFSGSLYLGGKIFKSKDVSVTGRMLIEGLLYAGLTTTIIKFTTGRSRPYMNEGNFNFNFFQTTNDYLSFPSGHSTVAFTLSSILSQRINNTYASVGLYSLALLTLWQRMYSDNHWLSDVILGASIGYFIGKAVVKFDDDSKANSRNDPVQSNGFSQTIPILSFNYSF